MARRGSIRANVLRLEDIGIEGFPSSDPFFHDHLILAEGDSWFSIGGFPPTNLLYGLRFRKMTMVVSCAKPGDTMSNMSRIAKNDLYKRALSQKFGYDWDLILLSGGGNDLIDAADRLVRNRSERRPNYPGRPEGYIKKSELAKLLRDVQKGFRKLAEVRDRTQSRAKGKPIVTHTYDYATPRNEPARFIGYPLLGPWLYPAFTNNDVPREMWLPLARLLIDELAGAILSLQKGTKKISNFHVVDTRGTLTPPDIDDIGPSTHWLNEIHPNHDGYSLIGRKIEMQKLYQLLY